MINRNTRIHLFLITVSLLLVIVPYLNKTPSRSAAEKSLFAASQFLFLVDTEEYARSWDVSSKTLQALLTKDAWDTQISELRSFLGPIIERVHQNTSYTDSASDVPPGEYVIMTFISKFELRERVTETITLMLGDNDQWRVVGYFIS